MEEQILNKWLFVAMASLIIWVFVYFSAYSVSNKIAENYYHKLNGSLSFINFKFDEAESLVKEKIHRLQRKILSYSRLLPRRVLRSETLSIDELELPVFFAGKEAEFFYRDSDNLLVSHSVKYLARCLFTEVHCVKDFFETVQKFAKFYSRTFSRLDPSKFFIRIDNVYKKINGKQVIEFSIIYLEPVG